MVKNITLFLSVLALASITLSSCGKKKPDGSEFAEVCAKIAKCDAQLAAVPDAQKQCQNLLAQVSEKLPATVPAIKECAEKTPCEELSLQKCAAPSMQELKGLVNP